MPFPPWAVKSFVKTEFAGLPIERGEIVTGKMFGGTFVRV